MTELIAVQPGFALFQSGDRGVVIDTRTVDVVSVEPIAPLLAGAAWQTPDAHSTQQSSVWAELATSALETSNSVGVTASALSGGERLVRVPRKVRDTAAGRYDELSTLLATGIIAPSEIERGRQSFIDGVYGEAGAEWAAKIVPVTADGLSANDPLADNDGTVYFAELGADNGLTFTVTSLYAMKDDGSWWLREYGAWSPTQAPDSPGQLAQLDAESTRAATSQLDEPGATHAELSITETKLFALAAHNIDFAVADALFAAVPYIDPAIRSANAKKQLRDAAGQFIKQGGQAHDAKGDRGQIVAVDRAQGTVQIKTEDGQTKTIPANEVTQDETNNDAAAAPVTEVTPEAKAQLPAAPQLVDDVNALIAKYQTQWQQEKAQAQPTPAVAAGTLADDPLALPPIEGDTPSAQLPDAPAAAPQEDAPAGADPVAAAGVTPLYLAEVDPQDTQAVLECLAVIPSTGAGDAVDLYKRDGGKWAADPELLQTIQGPTPPPLVELTPDVLSSVLEQIDGAGADAEAPTETPVAAAGYAALRKFSVGEDGTLVASTVQGPQLLKSYAETGIPDEVVGRLNEFVARQEVSPSDVKNTERLKEYWAHGEGAAKIRWGADGDWTRCHGHLSKYLGTERSKGYCSMLHHRALGYWPGERDKPGNPKSHPVVAGLEVEDPSVLGINFKPEYDDDYGPDSDLPHEHVPYAGDSDYIDSWECEVCGRDPEHPVHVVVVVVVDDDSDDESELLGDDTADDRGMGAAPRKYEFAVLASGDSVQGGQRFRIPLVVPEGKSSGDGRTFAPMSLTSRDMPISLMWQPEGDEGHKGAVIVGRLDHVERTEDGLGNAYGVFDTGPWGEEALRLVKGGMLRGISADLDEFEGELQSQSDESKISSQKILVKTGRLMGVTLVAKPAFAECTIELVNGDEMSDGEYSADSAEARVAALLASAAPLHPPAEWFGDPELERPTRLTITDEGRVFGHIAAWDVDHIGLPFGTRAPRSASNYEYFCTGALRTADGTDVSVGQLTLAGGHASLSADARAAVKHYDDTASAWADVCAGEDSHGIWVAGSLRPSVTPEQIRVARASSPSGDWRPIKGKLELVAACCVNVPGFPVARAMVSSGVVTALVAAGAMALEAERPLETELTLAARIEALEKAESRRVAERRAELSARMAPVMTARREALLSAAESARSRVSPVRDAKKASLTAAADAARARVQAAREFKSMDTHPGDGGLYIGEKFDEAKHPRDRHGKFRDVLARLTELLQGDSEAAPGLAKLNEAADAADAGDESTAKTAARDAATALDHAADTATDAAKGALKDAARQVLDAVTRGPDAPGSQEEDSTIADVLFDELTDEAKSMILDAVARAEEQLDPANPQEMLDKVKAFITGTNAMDPNAVANFVKNQLKRPFTIHAPAVLPQTPSAQPSAPVNAPGTAG